MRKKPYIQWLRPLCLTPLDDLNPIFLRRVQTFPVKSHQHVLNLILRLFLMYLLGRRDGSQCDTPIQEEVRDHSSLQANIRRTAGIQAFILK